MTDLNNIADRLNRTVKLALDTGEAASIEAAERIFASYRAQIVLGPDVAHKPVLQAMLLTAVNCAARTLLGGVRVVGVQGDLKVTLPPFQDLAHAVASLGGRLADTVDPEMPTLVIGDVAADGLEPLAIRATAGGWCGGVAPAARTLHLSEVADFTTPGVLAGAIAVAEIFQRLRGGQPMACRRAIGLDLWSPARDWRREGEAPPLDRLPAAAWLVGLGNLGQAYLWTLGLLPYGEEAAELVLQDFDVLAPSNVSTSLLTWSDVIGQRKSRAMARWAEARGFRTAIVERRFAPDFRVAPREPAVALIGVDNGLARQAVEEVGFERVIETGLGGGPQDFLGIDLHTFPASQPARQVWRAAAAEEARIDLPAYQGMLGATKDRCGTVRLAGRSIGAPFVGAVAAALAIAELARLTLGGPRYEMISCHLRDLEGRNVVQGLAWQPFNPGALACAA